MDPITAALNLAAKLTEAYIVFMQSATPEQRQKLVQFFIEDRQFWQKLIEKAVPT